MKLNSIKNKEKTNFRKKVKLTNLIYKKKMENKEGQKANCNNEKKTHTEKSKIQKEKEITN